VSAWVIWAIVAVAFAIGEVLTPGLFWLGPIALAAVLSGVVAAVGLGTGVQLVVFILGSLASLGILRPIARAHLHMPHALRTGTAALVGARGTIVDRTDAHGGRVKIGGEIWSARTLDESQVIEPGASVDIVKIEGATALVYE
jgi:membrane protein implicated in regulation of membrane protease activity